MNEFLIALGLVAVIEGLVLVLAPSRFEDLVRALESLGLEQRRMLGLGCIALGVVVIALVKYL